MIYVEEQPTRPAAMRRELQIKRMSRARKTRLIEAVGQP
jgi:predicted GIY-YIG superfamily endonuclease